MIVIVSNEVDESTNEVIKFCIINKINYIRFSEENFIDSVYIEVSNVTLSIKLLVNDSVIEFNNVTSFWFRKNDLLMFEKMKIRTNLEVDNQDLYKFIYNSEIKSLREFLIYHLEKKRFLGNYSSGDGNKLISFSIASEVGLNIPKSIISSDTKYLKNNSKGKVIIKPIEDGFYSNNLLQFSYTKYNLADKNSFLNKCDSIYPSCIQNYIDKKIEIRVFFIDFKIYTMAIFSQQDAKTQIDFRNYNLDKMNRMLPYKLPISIEIKICNLMKKMKLNTGSIDMIMTNDNEYVFLEVNPVGQYGMVQYFGNYDLSLNVFNYLTNEKR